MKYTREVKTIGKHILCIVKSPSFEKWLANKMDIVDFRKLSYKGKREIFLNWKWGTAMLEGNESAESTEFEIVSMIKEYTSEDWKKLNEEDRKWYQRKLDWNNLCYPIWKSIEDGTFCTTDRVKEVNREFGGTVN